jgi:hypothetical protein
MRFFASLRMTSTKFSHTHFIFAHSYEGRSHGPGEMSQLLCQSNRLHIVPLKLRLLAVSRYFEY